MNLFNYRKTDVLVKQAEGLPNITGYLGAENSNYVNAFQGVFAGSAFVVTEETQSSFFENYGSRTSTSKVLFDASRINSSYGKRNEVAPANYTYIIWKRIS